MSLYGTCFLSHSGLEMSSTTDGITVNKPFKSAGIVHIEERKIDRPKRTSNPANRLAQGVVGERPHVRKYLGTHIIERAT